MARRKKREVGFNASREERFFETLAASCNVTMSAAAAGVSSSSVYRRRAKDAAFRKRWGTTLAAAYAELELTMLERALHGAEKVVLIKGESQVIREYCDRTALALLKLHRDTVSEVERDVDDSEVAEASERILERLRRMRAQIEGRTETKASADRLALLAEALTWRRGQKG